MQRDAIFNFPKKLLSWITRFFNFCLFTSQCQRFNIRGSTKEDAKAAIRKLGKSKPDMLERVATDGPLSLDKVLALLKILT